MYRTQVYQDTSRVAGPYLPPYPLQGVGDLADMLSSAASTVQDTVHNTVYEARMTDVNGKYCDPGFVRGNSGMCEPCPKGTMYNGQEYTCDASPGSPGTPVAPSGGGGAPQVLPVNPSGPCPGNLVKGPGGSCVLPAQPASSTNMWLWIGIAAAVGVGGIIVAKRQRWIK